MVESSYFVDHYYILELQQTASSDEIKRQYKRLSLKRHPDKDPNNPKAKENFVALLKAFEILSDAATRRVFDRTYRTNKTTQESLGKEHHAKPKESHEGDSSEDRRRREREQRRAAVLKTNETKKEEWKRDEKRRAERENSKRHEQKQLQNEVENLQRYMKSYAEKREARLEREEKAKASQDDYPFVSKHTETVLSEEEKLSQKQKKLHALASHRIKVSQLLAKLEKLETIRKDINRIVVIRADVRAKLDKDAAQRLRDLEQEFAREDELRHRKENEEARVRAEKWRREQEEKRGDFGGGTYGWEDYVKAQRAEAKANEEAREKAQRAQEKAEKEEKERKARETESSWQRTRYSSHEHQSSYSSDEENECGHYSWWRKKYGAGNCEECSDFYRIWLMECRHCNMLACGYCMYDLRNGGSQRRGR